MGAMNGRLKRMYGRINRAWFGNRLPQNTSLRFRRMEPQGLISLFYVGPALIEISEACRRCGWNAVEMTLFHEMVHLELAINYSLREGHGKRFQTRMRQLAAKGAFDKLW